MKNGKIKASEWVNCLHSFSYFNEGRSVSLDTILPQNEKELKMFEHAFVGIEADSEDDDIIDNYDEPQGSFNFEEFYGDPSGDFEFDPVNFLRKMSNKKEDDGERSYGSRVFEHLQKYQNCSRLVDELEEVKICEGYEGDICISQEKYDNREFDVVISPDIYSIDAKMVNSLDIEDFLESDSMTPVIDEIVRENKLKGVESVGSSHFETVIESLSKKKREMYSNKDFVYPREYPSMVTITKGIESMKRDGIEYKNHRDDVVQIGDVKDFYWNGTNGLVEFEGNLYILKEPPLNVNLFNSSAKGLWFDKSIKYKLQEDRGFRFVKPWYTSVSFKLNSETGEYYYRAIPDDLDVSEMSGDDVKSYEHHKIRQKNRRRVLIGGQTYLVYTKEEGIMLTMEKWDVKRLMGIYDKRKFICSDVLVEVLGFWDIRLRHIGGRGDEFSWPLGYESKSGGIKVKKKNKGNRRICCYSGLELPRFRSDSEESFWFKMKKHSPFDKGKNKKGEGSKGGGIVSVVLHMVNWYDLCC